jgi:hypothetical protein
MAHKRYSEHDLLQQEVDAVEKRLMEVRQELASKTIKGKMLAMDEDAFGKEVEQMHALLKVRREKKNRERDTRFTQGKKREEEQRERMRQSDIETNKRDILLRSSPLPPSTSCCGLSTCAYLVKKVSCIESDSVSVSVSHTPPFLLTLPPLLISPTLYH